MMMQIQRARVRSSIALGFYVEQGDNERAIETVRTNAQRAIAAQAVIPADAIAGKDARIDSDGDGSGGHCADNNANPLVPLPQPSN
jgi:hypothetical protein